jgi:thiamine monophosphate kinase
MDLSDGLLSTAFTLAELNGLGITLREEKLPVSGPALGMARRFSIDPLRFAFGTGDWQVAYAIRPDDWRQLSRTSGPLSQLVSIGVFTEEHAGVCLVCKDGHTRPLHRIEQQHFLDTSADSGFLEYLLATPLFLG